MNHLFTPKDKDGNRLAMLVNDEDREKTDRRGRITADWNWTAEITDQCTGKRYSAMGAPCGIKSCFCDAVVTEIEAEVILCAPVHADPVRIVQIEAMAEMLKEMVDKGDLIANRNRPTYFRIAERLLDAASAKADEMKGTN